MEPSVVVLGLTRQAQIWGLPMPYLLVAAALTILPFFLFKALWWLLSGPLCYLAAALLRKSSFGLMAPFPAAFQAIASISALPRAEKRFMISMRVWISAICRSGSRDMIRSPKSFRRFIWASTRLRTW
jgi:hypothetical protein